MNLYNLTISHHVSDISEYRINRTLPEDEHSSIRTSGRILALRTYRSILFFDLYEDGQYIQCSIRASVAPIAFQYFRENISRGNLIWVSGVFSFSDSGEVTLFVTDSQLINRNLELIGDLHDGFNTTHGRQQRELDLMLNHQSMLRFQQRSSIIWNIRSFFNQQRFIEVETPILQSVASGAQATPFITHFNSHSRDAFLRIAPETYLVRLLIGGMSRIFEIGHNFRNEGISPRHNPEFSMLEFYETFSNLEQTIEMTQNIIRSCICSIGLSLDNVSFGNISLNFNNFYRYTVSESLVFFLNYSNENIQSREFLLSIISENNLTNTMPSNNISWLQYIIFEHLIEPLLIQPTFITQLPVEASPLAYSLDNETTERFELFCAGREIANGFQQVIDYEEQVTRFEFQSQISGRDSAMEADIDYLNAIRYGIPTLSGCGIGIDRLIMLLTNTENIRDIILYPM
jgi:lysyl-tRNA synthetase class 2